MRPTAGLGVVVAVVGTAFLGEYYGGWWWLLRWPVFIVGLALWSTWWSTWLTKHRAARMVSNPPPAETGLTIDALVPPFPGQGKGER
ncbi:MAG: hypothetical protein ACRDSP_26765 [Pseudonocardiaceae bacterium]